MTMPGSDLSQPANVTIASNRSACMTVSTLSAMTSRDTSEARMPSWPIEMPSETAIVVNSIGKPPAAWTPSFASRASRASGRLQGVTSFQEEATPTCGLPKSCSVMPTARSIARAGARSKPSVTSVLRGRRIAAPFTGRRRRSSPSADGAGSVARPAGTRPGRRPRTSPPDVAPGRRPGP